MYIFYFVNVSHIIKIRLNNYYNMLSNNVIHIEYYKN